jgi:hypothetical protein
MSKLPRLFIFISLLTILASVASGAPLFFSQARYEAPGLPRDAVAADLDGDGDIDLAIANDRLQSTTILLNNGFGRFCFAGSYFSDYSVYHISSADLDNDGDADLVTVTGGISSMGFGLDVWMNNGDATFQPPVHYDVGQRAFAVFATTIDDDEYCDLAVADFLDNVIIMLNNGDGTFPGPYDSYDADIGPIDIVVVDLSGDGEKDIAVANCGSYNVSVLINSGDGSYENAVNYSVGDMPVAIYSIDFDGDNDNDLVTANNVSNSITVLENSGTGVFEDGVDFLVGTGPNSVFAADFDKNGFNDIAVTNVQDNNATILLGNGDCTFTLDDNYELGSDPGSILAADFDDDTDLDLVSANSASKNVSILKNQTIGVTSPPDVAMVVSAEYHGAAVAIFHNDGSGGLTYTERIPIPNAKGGFSCSDANGARPIIVDHLNDDNAVDLIVSCGEDDLGSGMIATALGDGDGSFSAFQTFTHAELPHDWFSMTALHLDNDCNLDLAGFYPFRDTLFVFGGDGEGSFTGVIDSQAIDSPCIYVAKGENFQTKFFAVNSQIQTADLYQGVTTVFDYKPSSGVYASEAIAHTDLRCGFLSTGDFDNQFGDDLITYVGPHTLDPEEPDPRYRVFKNNDWTFYQDWFIPEDISQSGLLLPGHFDDDGFLDVASFDLEDGPKLFIAWGDGDGSFEDYSTWPLDNLSSAPFSEPYNMQVADIDGDGYDDVLITYLDLITDPEPVWQGFIRIFLAEGDRGMTFCPTCEVELPVDQVNGLNFPGRLVTGNFSGEVLDADGDGVHDFEDNCPSISNPSQQNSDDDSFGDACDNCPDDDNEDQSDFDGDGVGYVCDNCPIYANPNQEDANSDGIGDACTFAESTPTGSEVSVTLDQNVEVTFTQILTGGTTELTEVTYGDDISGFTFVPSDPYKIYYQIITDAEYSGPIEVCITYDDSELEPEAEGTLSLMHSDGGVWNNITSSLDGDNNIICGTTTDLSPFVVAYPEPTYVCGDADGNGMVNISDAVFLITYIFGSGPAPDPLLSGDADCNQIVNISDAVYLIAYIFGGGPEPCVGC